MLSTIRTCPEDGGGFPILFGSAVGSFVMFTVLLYKKKVIWTLLETTVSILITICIILWITKGAYQSVVFGILSEIIVGVYLIIRTIKCPMYQYNLAGYVLFLLASIVATYNASDWSIPQIGYALSEVVLTTITIIPLVTQMIRDRS